MSTRCPKMSARKKHTGCNITCPRGWMSAASARKRKANIRPRLSGFFGISIGCPRHSRCPRHVRGLFCSHVFLIFFRCSIWLRGFAVVVFAGWVCPSHGASFAFPVQLSTFYQLFINLLSTFHQLVYQLFINFLSTCYQLLINLFINFFINFLIKSTFSYL